MVMSFFWQILPKAPSALIIVIPSTSQSLAHDRSTISIFEWINEWTRAFFCHPSPSFAILLASVASRWVLKQPHAITCLPCVPARFPVSVIMTRKAHCVVTNGWNPSCLAQELNSYATTSSSAGPLFSLRIAHCVHIRNQNSQETKFFWILPQHQNPAEISHLGDSLSGLITE